MGPVKTILVGYGVGGAVFHAPVIDAVEGLDLAAIVTGDPGRREQAHRRHPHAEVVPDVERLFAAPRAYDLAVITVPNRHHVTLATRALEAGLHVVVDKPFAGTAAEGRALAELADRRGLMLSVYHNRRFDGDFRTVRRLVADGELGDVHRFESRFERWRPRLNAGAWKEDADPAALGGILYDLGSHLIDQAVTLFGRPVRVYAELDRVRDGALVDDDSFVALTHTDGTRSHLWMSAAAADPGPRFRLLGSRASYVKYGMDPQEAALRAHAGPADPGWGAEPRDAWGTLGTPDGTHMVETLPGAYQDYYAGVVRALRNGAELPVTTAEAVTVLEVVEAARRSSADGVTVELAPL